MSTDSRLEFIDRESSIESTSDTSNTTESTTDRNETLYGYDVEEPRGNTTKIGGTTSSDSGTRTTKSGRIDGRTKEGRAARSGGSYGTTETGTRKNETVSASLDIGLTDILFGIHQGIAGLLHAPEFKLDKGEAKQLSESMQKVAKFYSVSIDPKKVAIFELGAVAFGLYAPRFLAMNIRKKESAPNVRQLPKQQPQPSTAKVNGKLPDVNLEGVTPSQLNPMGAAENAGIG